MALQHPAMIMCCESGNWWGWKFMTALSVFEILVALFSSVAWGTGFTEYVLKRLVESGNCTQPCLKVVHLSFHDWQIVASVLYGVAIFFALMSLLGLLSGQLSLQVPNLIFCILKIGFTIYICEKLLDAHQGPMMYKANRIFMYCATVWNIVTLGFNVRQVKSESERIDIERSGRRPAEIRPLTEAFAPYFQNCNWCRCGYGNGNAYEVNSNEISVQIHEDARNGRDHPSATNAPLLSPRMASSAVDGNAFSPAVVASIPADIDVKHSAVDIREASSLEVNNVDISDKSEGNDLKGSASRQSTGMGSSQAGEKLSERRYASGDDSRGEKSPKGSWGKTTDDSSDEELLLKDR